MEEIATELSILKKSFPFIKFTFVHKSEIIRIWINSYDINGYNYRFWGYTNEIYWEIQGMLNTDTFDEFLDNFIRGLIKWKLY